MGIDVLPATAERWGDVATVFAGPPTRPGCWCQRFLRHDAADAEAALREEVRTAAVPVGLVAYADGEPAGWSRVVPRGSLPGIVGNTALGRLLAADDHSDREAWWVSCFAVRRGSRGRGVGLALLTAAVEFAREHGAAVLDGHPVDVQGLRGSPSPSALFTGTKAMFDAAGFVEIGRTYPTRPLMRHGLG